MKKLILGIGVALISTLTSANCTVAVYPMPDGGTQFCNICCTNGSCIVTHCWR